jgi:mRNA interferase MazF
VVARNEIYWATLEPPGGRRPICILTRTRVIAARSSLTCAPVTRRVRGIPSEVEVGPEEGLPHPGVINCDNVMTVPKAALDPEPLGKLDAIKRAELDRALRFALGIKH